MCGHVKTGGTREICQKNAAAGSVHEAACMLIARKAAAFRRFAAARDKSMQRIGWQAAGHAPANRTGTVSPVCRKYTLIPHLSKSSFVRTPLRGCAVAGAGHLAVLPFLCRARRLTRPGKGRIQHPPNANLAAGTACFCPVCFGAVCFGRGCSGRACRKACRRDFRCRAAYTRGAFVRVVAGIFPA